MNSSSELSKEKKESKNMFKNLKSDYFLQLLFNNLLKKKSLEIIKYNNNIKNRINISIKDYKEYSEVYSSIEIELKPVNNEYGQFININQEDEIYYHIYFNNNTKKEIKEYYIKEKDNVKNIKIRIDYQVKSFFKLFEYCGCIEIINFKTFYRSNIINMSNIFYNCKNLKKINFSNFNTNNVTNMKGMFYRCSDLKELNLSNFNTENVIDMSYMFYECSSLKELNISNFNINNVKNMTFMFYDCSSLKEINISNFIINKDTNVRSMFSECLDELVKNIKAQIKNINIEAFY